MSLRSFAAARRISFASLAVFVFSCAATTAQDADLSSCRLDVREVAREVGVRFVHDRGASGAKHLPETMGSGAVWLDYDGDGWQDLYLVQSGDFPGTGSSSAANRLFRNQGGRRFSDETAAARAGETGYGQGAVPGDFDGDGDLDLYVANFSADALLLNLGDGRFETGAVEGVGTDGWSSSVAAADVDGDRQLDLYVTTYVEYDVEDVPFCGDEAGERRYCDPSLFVGGQDRLLMNGPGGFRDGTVEAGLTAAAGRGLGVVVVDLDGDAWPDIYVANDLTENLLFRNRGDGTFEDLSLMSGTAVNRDGRREAGMGIASGDFDGDGALDLTVTNFDVETNTFYRNLGNMMFSDESASTGFGPPSFNLLGFGVVAADFDADGDEDVWIANGHIFERPNRDNTGYAQRDQVLLWQDGGFVETRCPALSDEPTVGRGLAAADYDNDGDFDVALQQNGREAKLFRSEGARRWAGVDLRGFPGNTEGVGARVVLSSDMGERSVRVIAGDSYQSASDRRVLFTLRPGEQARAVRVSWPSGAAMKFGSVPEGRYLRIFESRPD